jgi:hypothetical protein
MQAGAADANHDTKYHQLSKHCTHFKQMHFIVLQLLWITDYDRM